MSGVTYGIDLGTTCSAIAVVEAGRPRLIEVDGEVLVPSVVAFGAEGVVAVGRAAVNLLELRPESTVRSSKRWMGTDREFEVAGRWVRPREVAAAILGHLLDAAAEGERPTRAVITVPAWFTQEQRADTRAAAEAAGLEAVRLVNEPTAVALAHVHLAGGGEDGASRRILVFDFGGGTFDASLVEVAGTLVEVKASRGDTFLGGDDVDRALVGRLVGELAGRDPALAEAVTESRAAGERLALAAREAKHVLSEETVAEVRVPFLIEHGGKSRHLESRLRREEVDEALAPLLLRALDCVEDVLREAGVGSDEVDELVLVGGSTRIPRVWQVLLEAYGWEGSAAVPVDRAVALGAAIQGALVDGGRIEGALVDVAPFALSTAALDVELGGERMRMVAKVVTPRNAPLPARHSRLFYTVSPQQRALDVAVFQGSDPNPLRNRILGRIHLAGLPPAPSGQTSRTIAVRFDHDLDGMVSIEVRDELSGLASQVRLACDGVEVGTLREEFLEHLQREGLQPGDGTDPDPWLEREESREEELRAFELVPRAAPEGVPAAATADTEEARRGFALLLEEGRRDELGEAADELVGLAREGLSALAEGDAGRVLEVYDRLSDRLFELGVFL